jgi:hypothetical protein
MDTGLQADLSADRHPIQLMACHAAEPSGGDLQSARSDLPAATGITAVGDYCGGIADPGRGMLASQGDASQPPPQMSLTMPSSLLDTTPG